MTRGRMRRRVERAVRSADWIDRDGSDAIAVGAIYDLADQLDGLRRDTLDGQTSPESAGKAAFVAQVLLRYLSEMGLTAKSKPAPTEETGGLMATLTAIAGGQSDGATGT